MSDDIIFQLADIAALAQQHVQNTSNIDTMIIINRKKSQQVFAVDLLLIDHLKTNKRIIILFQDNQPNQISFQFSSIQAEPNDDYQTLAVEKANQNFFTSIMQQGL